MYRAISRIFLHSHLDPLVIANDRIAYCADSHKHEVTPVINDIHNGNEHYPGDVLNDTAPPRLVGCTLITPEMRETFVQNPGVRRIVPLND